MRQNYEWARRHLEVEGLETPDDDVFAQMIEAGWTRPHENLDVTNCVSTGRLRINQTEEPSFNLQSMALALRPYGAQINVPRFPVITFPIASYINVRAVLFSTGFLIITGFRLRIEMLYALEYVRRLLYRCGYTGVSYNVGEFKTQNVVARKILPEAVNKKKFQLQNLSADSSSRFPGLCVQFVKIDPETGAKRAWTTLVFNSPRCVFVGWKTAAELQAMNYLILPMLFLATGELEEESVEQAATEVDEDDVEGGAEESEDEMA